MRCGYRQPNQQFLTCGDVQSSSPTQTPSQILLQLEILGHAISYRQFRNHERRSIRRRMTSISMLLTVRNNRLVAPGCALNLLLYNVSTDSISKCRAVFCLWYCSRFSCWLCCNIDTVQQVHSFCYLKSTSC